MNNLPDVFFNLTAVKTVVSAVVLIVQTCKK